MALLSHTEDPYTYLLPHLPLAPIFSEDDHPSQPSGGPSQPSCQPSATKLYSSDQPLIPYAVDDPTGLSSPYLYKFWFEDKDHVDDAEFYMDCSQFPLDFAVHRTDAVKSNTLKLVSRFLKQVRESGGYDVDCMPPLMFNSPYIPLSEEDMKHYRQELPNYYKSRVDIPIDFALERINVETGCDHKLVDILRVVATRTSAVFLTFSAAASDGSEKTFRALVSSPFCVGWEKELELELVEWKITAQTPPKIVVPGWEKTEGIPCPICGHLLLMPPDLVRAHVVEETKKRRNEEMQKRNAEMFED